MDFVFDALGWTEVIHTIGPDNVRLIALAQRLGSTNGSLTLPPDPFQAARVDARAKMLRSGAAALCGSLKRGR